ncbi:CDP-alcohol phosphatidyltransferase family protein [Pseudarthrobacter sp. B907]|uniref:CDP-alcohol phosphatidyltransferase family protein n=1 Tax=Pseudarthrobacter sp. B907 TaxID=3158261 RepID=UPI0032DBC74C
MAIRTPGRGSADVAAAAAAYFAAGGWLVSVHSPDPLAGLVATGAGAAVMVRTAGSILQRRPRVCTPADRVTLVRAVLVACCAALAATGFLGRQPPGTLLLLLGATAWALDALDGPVARRTRSASEAGARLDTETDAALTLVLSCAAAAALGPWTLLIGSLYYAFTAAGRFRPALRKTLPPSRARKAIGAVQPGALLLALAPGVPADVGAAGLLAALALLLFSFGRDAAALERRAAVEPEAAGTAVIPGS